MRKYVQNGAVWWNFLAIAPQSYSVISCLNRRKTPILDMKMNSFKMIAASAVLALAGGAAQAATISFFGSTGVVSSTGSVDLQQFDGSLGTLTGISIVWDSGFSARFSAVQGSASSTGVVSGADGFAVSTIVNIASPVGTSVPDLSATAGTAFSASIPPNYSQIVAGGDSDTRTYGPLASFIGLGTVSYTFSGTASDTTAASNGVLRGMVDYLFLVNADITYTYDEPAPAVPLPASLPLLLAGLGGLHLMRRKKAA